MVEEDGVPNGVGVVQRAAGGDERGHASGKGGALGRLGVPGKRGEVRACWDGSL